MKFFITSVSLCMIFTFYISEADKNFFIFAHSRIRELFSGQKWIRTSYFTTGRTYPKKTICEQVKNAKIFIANRPTSDNEIDETSNYIESDFFLNEDWNSRTTETVRGKHATVELLIHDEKIKTSVITCEFGPSETDKIYVARRRSSKHYFFFGKTDERDTLPNLLAIGMHYMGVDTIETSKGIEDVIWEYTYNNDKATSHRIAKKLFKEDGVDIFLLCASISYYEESKEDKEMKYKYIITIPGPQNNLSKEVPVENIIKSPPRIYAQKSVPLLTCQIKRKVNNEYPIKFKFYILPNITLGESSGSNIFAIYDTLNGSKVTQVNKHYNIYSTANI